MKQRRSVFFDYSQATTGRLRMRAARGMGFWHRTLILGAVVSLSVSVATRYCTVVRYAAQATKIAQSHSLEAKRQHLLNDGLHWSAPAAAFVLFEPTRVSSAALPAVPPITRLYSENCLYNRPPPSC